MHLPRSISRRLVLFVIAAAMTGGACSFAYAEDDESESEGGGGNDSSDDDGSSNDGDGESQGSSNSGATIGGGTINNGSDQNKAQDAVKSGAAMPLSKAFELLALRHPGRVIEVMLVTKGNGFDYRFKVIDDTGNVSVATMDAVSGRFRNRFGF